MSLTLTPLAALYHIAIGCNNKPLLASMSALLARQRFAPWQCVGPKLSTVTIACNSPHCHTLPEHATTNHNKPLLASMNALLASQQTTLHGNAGALDLLPWVFDDIYMYLYICVTLCIFVCDYMSLFCVILLVMPFDIVSYLWTISAIFSEQVITPFEADQNCPPHGHTSPAREGTLPGTAWLGI